VELDHKRIGDRPGLLEICERRWGRISSILYMGTVLSENLGDSRSAGKGRGRRRSMAEGGQFLKQEEVPSLRKSEP